MMKNIRLFSPWEVVFTFVLVIVSMTLLISLYTADYTVAAVKKLFALSTN
jgi:hypothetical protein